MEFTVKVTNGDVFINGEFVSQLCFDNDSIGYAVTAWLDGDCDDDAEFINLCGVDSCDGCLYQHSGNIELCKANA